MFSEYFWFSEYIKIDFVLTLICCSLTVCLIIWRKSNYYKGMKLPPGPIRWPVIGSIPQMAMIDKKYPHRQLAKLSEKYGGIMSVGLGIHYAVVISEFDIMNDLLKRPELNSERYLLQFIVERTKGRNLGIGFSHGETWKVVRKFTIKKLREFGFGKARFLEETMQDEMDCLMRYIREQSENSEGLWKIETDRIAMVSINMLWSSVAGYRFDPSTDLLKRHLAMNKEMFEIMGPAGNLLQVFPFLKFFPKWSGYKRHLEIHKAAWQLMTDQLGDAKLKKEGRIAGETDSFVDAFLDEIERNHRNPGSIMTEDQLTVVLMDLFLASTESTRTFINWLILYFTLFPHVQNRAREEIWRMSENTTKRILLTDRNRMPYIFACIYETIRHSSFIPLPPARQASYDIIYGNYVIPKGTCVMYNLYPVFHDPKFWGDPQNFRPERLLDLSGKTLNLKKMERITQFGFGKRICPGETQALDLIFSFVVSLLSTFSVEVKAGVEPSLKPGTPSLSVGPADYVAKFLPLIN